MDSYLLLSEILFEEGKAREGEKALNEAYERAVKLITGRNGSWPDVLSCGWLGNRHIIRTIFFNSCNLCALPAVCPLLKIEPPAVDSTEGGYRA